MRERLITWLLDNGYAEERRGYGHVTAEDLADALIETWHIEEKNVGLTFSLQDASGAVILEDATVGDLKRFFE